MEKYVQLMALLLGCILLVPNIVTLIGTIKKLNPSVGKFICRFHLLPEGFFGWLVSNPGICFVGGVCSILSFLMMFEGKRKNIREVMITEDTKITLASEVRIKESTRKSGTVTREVVFYQDSKAFKRRMIKDTLENAVKEGKYLVDVDGSRTIAKYFIPHNMKNSKDAPKYLTRQEMKAVRKVLAGRNWKTVFTNKELIEVLLSVLSNETFIEQREYDFPEDTLNFTGKIATVLGYINLLRYS